MTELERAIIKTLAYADLFDQALTLEELQRYLIELKASLGELSKGVQGCKVVRLEGEVVCLSGREDLFNQKSLQLETTNYKLETARRWVWLFACVPWVKMVAVTGSVAGGSPDQEDDIDLVVVTAPGRLWLSRTVLVGLLSILGKRRKPDDNPKKVNNKLCLNMWLDEDNLLSQQQDIYVANELAHMVPILNRQKSYETYIASNGWLNDFLPNFVSSNKHFSAKELLASHTSDQQRKAGALGWLDARLGEWQKQRMRPRTKETVADGQLLFHPRDYRNETLEKYQSRLKELNV